MKVKSRKNFWAGPTVLGLIGAVVLASGSLIKAMAMILLGLLLGQVNTDVISGVATPAVLRGTALGSILGVLPGGGALLSSPGTGSSERQQAWPH